MTARFDELQQPRDLYSIPASSSWFNWDSIHDTERRALPEFFDGGSYSRNPRVYKEYRDFIINKFREDPTRRLTFTEVRKSLIGDVGSLERVFRLLDRWGLINFRVESGEVRENVAAAAAPAVVVEEGAPVGVRVVPAVAGRGWGGAVGETGGGFRLPALSSYSDVFGDWSVRKGPVCAFCGGQCGSGKVEIIKGGYSVCSKCSKNEKGEEEKLGDDREALSSLAAGGDSHVNNAWTDAETLLLLEAVLKHGDDWDLIAQHVRTKSKLECIARLIHLPFGEHILGPIRSKLDGSRYTTSEPTKAVQHVLKELPEETANAGAEQQPVTDGKKRIAEENSATRPAKKSRLPCLTDVTGSLTEQVALLSTVAGPHITAAAAEAAVAALCQENPCARKAFEIDDQVVGKFGLSTNESGSNHESEDQEAQRHKTDSPEKSYGATTFRIRAAIATSLGSAAARAKLLADQEVRGMELLMASIIETQVKKMKIKMKHFDELELIMEKEYSQIQQIKESILEEWVGILQRATCSGIARWKDHRIPKLQSITNS